MTLELVTDNRKGSEVALDLWVWPLRVDPASREGLAAHLDPTERAHAEALDTPALTEDYVVARGRLREILGGQMGCAPRDVPLGSGPRGKPVLAEGAAGAGPSFNLSHAAGWVALVTGPHALPLGIDIERHREVSRDLAARHFSDAELAELDAVPAESRTAAFFNGWTRKEAMLKALGAGLSRPLDSFDVTLTPGAPARLTRLSGALARRWQLVPLSLGPTYAGCIALRHEGPVALTLREGHLPLPA